MDEWNAQQLEQTPEGVQAYQREAYYGGARKPEDAEHARLLAGWTRGPGWPRVACDAALTTGPALTRESPRAAPSVRGTEGQARALREE